MAQKQLGMLDCADCGGHHRIVSDGLSRSLFSLDKCLGSASARIGAAIREKSKDIVSNLAKIEAMLATEDDGHLPDIANVLGEIRVSAEVCKSLARGEK